jgi:hypothetical protein
MHSISYQGRIEATKKREHAMPAAEENEVATCKQGAYRFFCCTLFVAARADVHAWQRKFTGRKRLVGGEVQR